MIRDLVRTAWGNSCRETLKSVATVIVFTGIAITNLSADPALDHSGSEGRETMGGESGDELPQTHDPLELVMQSIVAVEVQALENARTADTFGATRRGTGVVIDTRGLIVTAGDIIAEAEKISITFSTGEVSKAELVAYDHRSGLGLVRAQTSAPTVAMVLGESAKVKVDDLGMIIPAGGEKDAVAVKVGKIDSYAGGWEYIIDKAIFTYPPSTNFSGAALVSESARLLGIGTLVSIDIDIDPKIRVPGNVFVPVDSLTGVLGKLLVDGRSDTPDKQPWIGLDVKNSKRGIAVSSVTPGGPAEIAGIRTGDVLVALNKKKIEGLSEFFKTLWQIHKPGDQVEIMVLRGAVYQTIHLTAKDYHDWLRKPAANTQLTELAD